MEQGSESPFIERSSWYIRHAVEADAIPLLIYKQTIASEPVNNTSVRPGMDSFTAKDQLELIRKYDRNPNSALFIVEANDEIIGLLKITDVTQPGALNVVELSLNVRFDYRGQGIGSALLEHAICWAKHHSDTSVVQLEVMTRNAKAVQLYERMGFKIMRTRPNAYFAQDEGGYIAVHVMAQLV